jgi:hypothetical protein
MLDAKWNDNEVWGGDYPPELEAMLEAQSERLREPFTRYISVAQELHEVSTKLAVALLTSPYCNHSAERIGADAFFRYVRDHMACLVKLLEDRHEDRLTQKTLTKRCYTFGFMPVNTYNEFKQDFGHLFDIWTDGDGDDRNGTDLVKVMYGLTGSYRGSEEEDGEGDDEDQENEEEQEPIA